MYYRLITPIRKKSFLERKFFLAYLPLSLEQILSPTNGLHSGQPMDWNSALSSMHREFPFTERIRFGVGAVGDLHSLPHFLKLSLYPSLKNSALKAPYRLCIALPIVDSSAIFLALGLCLNEIKTQSVANATPSTNFAEGDKVLYDGVDYVYKGIQTNEHGDFIILGHDVSNSSSTRMIRKADGARLQLSVSSRKTGKRPRPKQASVIDALLDLNLGNNTSSFETSTALVTRVGATRETITRLLIGSERAPQSTILTAFGIANINSDGNLIAWGRHGRKEEPALLVSPELLNLRDFIEEKSGTLQHVVLDGAASVSDLVSLDGLLQMNLGFLAILSTRDEDAIKQLEKRGFKVWAWNSDDAKSFSEDTSTSNTDPFRILRSSLVQAANFNLQRHRCCLPHIQDAFEGLAALKKTMQDDHHHASELYEKLYRTILTLSRTASSGEMVTNKFAVTINEIESFLKQFVLFLDKAQVDIGTEVISNLQKSTELLLDPQAKSSVLLGLLKELKAQGVRKVAVVLNKATFEIDREFLSQRFSKDFLYFEKSSSFKISFDTEVVVIVGSFGVAQMLSIFSESLGKKIHALCYSHEDRWISTSEIRFLGVSRKPHYRQSEIFGQTRPGVESTPVNDVEAADEESLDSFELAISRFKRNRIEHELRSDSSGKKEPARYVTFTQGGHAFLTDNYSVLVVNELLREGTALDRIPRRKLKDLNSGDFVLFRESADEDLIRQLADYGLKKKNQEHLRSVAGRWRETLVRLFEQNGRSMSRLKLLLSKHGINRNEVTVRNWLFDEGMIAPRDEQDILGIAKAADDDDLKLDFPSVCEAASLVRGAHIQAARVIGDKLVNSIKGDLADLKEDTVAIEVTGVGKVYVVCISTIDDSSMNVPIHRLNRYLI